MTYVKVQKNKAYFKRFQVKYRRRREGKTDYYARHYLVVQDKTKYNSPKFRYVVRVTNKDVVCQILSATIKGDVVQCAAYAHELPRYGIPLGLTNYSSVYATGLLCGRRMLQKLGLDKKFAGTETTGAQFLTEEAEGSRPFKCALDVGLCRTTTGARVFAGLKGAVDAGLYIPHSESRFPGWNREDKALNYDVFRKYLFAGHVAEYMRSLEEDDQDAFQKQFSAFIRKGITADSLEKLYKDAYAKIRADPSPAAKKAAKAKVDRRTPKRTHAERKHRIRQILAKRAAAMGSAAPSEAGSEEDDE